MKLFFSMILALMTSITKESFTYYKLKGCTDYFLPAFPPSDKN